MLTFIPFDDLSTAADQASSIDNIDFEFIQAGESGTKSFRIGTSAIQAISLFSNDPTICQISPATTFDLNANEITDTISITLTMPLDVVTGPNSIDLIAETDTNGTYVLRLDFVAVGANVARDSEFPERQTDFTNNVSDVILRAAEPLKMFRFDPIPFDPDDNRVIVDFSLTRKLGEGGSHRFISQSPEERLNPLNATWGYSKSDTFILGSFQEENASIQTTFEATSTTMNYSCSAKLFVGAEFEFLRNWALFAPENDPDPEQHKRTVFLILRRGEFYCLHLIETRYRGNELAHHEIDLVQIERANMGSPDTYNPFALSTDGRATSLIPTIPFNVQTFTPPF